MLACRQTTRWHDMRSGNPALNDSTFLDLGTGAVVQRDAAAMTLNGTVNKTALLLVLPLVGAMYTWSRYFAGDGAELMRFVWGGLIGDRKSVVTGKRRDVSVVFGGWRNIK